jgi:hypothetical protein
MTRTARFSLRVIVISSLLALSLGANALPLSPKWMKSSVDKKVTEPGHPGELPDLGGGTGGGVTALPLPGSIWLIAIGIAGMRFIRRK